MQGLKRFQNIGLLVIGIVVIIFIYNFINRPRTVEDMLERGYEVVLDNYSVEALVESDRCQDFYDPKEYVPGEILLNTLLSLNWARDRISWSPFNEGDHRGGKRIIGFVYLDPDTFLSSDSEEQRQGNYSILVKDGKMIMSIDEPCYPELGNLILIPYQFNRGYDLSKANKFKFVVEEVEGKFELNLTFKNSLTDSKETYSTKDYEISSTGEHFFDIRNSEVSQIDWKNIDDISIYISGYGNLVMKQPSLIP